MNFSFGNLIGVYSLLSLIPLIIIYLIKPRPTKLKIPSLMFFMNNSNTSKPKSLFRYFQRDILFFIQLLILLLLSLSIAQPILNLNRDVVSSNIVFVLDVSASSQVINENNKTRLDFAKDKIKELTTSKNSLILLKSSPVVALQDVSKSKLEDYLNRLEATDDISDVGAAISLAGDLLQNNKGRVVVLSDFVESKGVNAEVSKNLVESHGIPVDFINTQNGFRNNIGIVDMIINGEDVNLYIKNYENSPKEISLKINKDVSKLTINPNSVEPFVFTLKDNLTNVEILEKDDFLADNSVLINKPYSDQIKVLLISSNSSKFLTAALNSIDGVKLTIAKPPVIPDANFDIYVISDLDTSKLVKGTFTTLLQKVQNEGKSVILSGQKEIDTIDFEGLSPVKFLGFGKGGLTSIEQLSAITKDVDFGQVKNIFNVSENKEGINLVSVNNQTVISLFKINNGNIAYYGILEDESDFKLTPGYPIFWNNLIDYLAGHDDLNSFNLKTGYLFDIANTTKVLDKKGIYKFGEKIFSVNLLNERESDINYFDNTTKVNFTVSKLEKLKSNVDSDLSFYLIFIIFLLVLFELFYIKFRGEL